jgi:tripartite-type tricarboxylate transporter receptor subunit TctC
VRRTIRHLSVALVLIAAGIAIAKAETYPSRPITIVVPYPAGGPTDTLARILTDRMSGSLGQPLIIENVAGAGGSERAVRPARPSR